MRHTAPSCLVPHQGQTWASPAPLQLQMETCVFSCLRWGPHEASSVVGWGHSLHPSIRRSRSDQTSVKCFWSIQTPPGTLIVLKISHKPCWPQMCCAAKARNMFTESSCSVSCTYCRLTPVALTLKSGSSQCSSCWLQAPSCSGPPHMSQFQSSGSTEDRRVK